jgi:hypothetical protein
MPDETIVDSWRVITVSSAGLTRFIRLSSMDRPVFFSTTSMTVMPWARS